MINIRQEIPEDATVIWKVNEKAFGQSQEADIVDKIRADCANILSLVALRENMVVGHIFFSPAVIESVNGEVEGITAGQSVTFQAHVAGGQLPYSYEWSLKEENDPSWTAVGSDNPVWMWTSLAGDQGIYDIRCRTTDERGLPGEVVWKNFPVE